MRLLFVTSTRIGDAVLSTGVLDRLLRKYPGAQVTVAAGPLALPLFEGVPGLERLIAIEKRPANLHWPALWAATVRRPWGLAVDLRGSGLAWLIPARRRLIGPVRRDGLHQVERLGRVLGSGPVPEPRLWPSPDQEAKADRLIPDGGPVLALGPAANWPGKQWPAERFAELARRLTGPEAALTGARLAVLAADHERDQALPVLEAVPAERRIDLIGSDLGTAAACLRRCTLYIGNDSGLMHIAAAAGTPTLGLFGPTEDRRYRPWGGHTDVVRTPESYETLNARRAPPGAPQPSLMTTLSVERVVEAADALLRRIGGA